MNQTLIKNVNIWTMDEEDTRFYGWVLLENGKIASMGEGEPPASSTSTRTSVCTRMVSALRARTATRTPIRRRRTCVHWTASTRSTAASARHLRPV